MRKIWLFLLLNLFIVIGLTFLAERLEAQDVWDFGEAAKGEVIARTFSIPNLKSSSLVIESVSSSCECVKVEVSKRIAWPGERIEVIVSYDTRKEPTGAFSKDIYVNTNQGEKIFRITGSVIKSRELKAEEQKLSVYLAYFYSVDCKKCEKVKEILDQLKQIYPNLAVKEFDMAIRENRLLCEAMSRKFGVPKRKTLVPPMLFVGNDFVIGKEISFDKLDGLLKAYAGKGSPEPWLEAEEQISEAEVSIVGRFQSFSILPIIGAGLVDGINPCAFTTIVFFISFLTFTGYQKRQIIWIGSSFALAVFLTYLLIGLGLFKFFRSLQIFALLSQLLFVATAGLALILGILSLYDYFRYKKTGDIEGLKLRLPGVVKRRIQATITSDFRIEEKGRGCSILKLVIAALIVGFIVSLLESICTGQVYLPTILYIIALPHLKMRAILYLVIYNLMFILPLIVIFLFALAGATSEQFSRFARRHLGGVKLTTALLFFGLAILLVVVD